MRRLTLAVTVVLATSVAPVGAVRAQMGLGAVDSWISGENQLLMHIWLTNLEQATQLSTLVVNGKMLLGSMNEALALSRHAYQIGKGIYHYDLNKLKRDALGAMYQTWPELADAQRELNLLIANGEAIDSGPNAFFSHFDRHDTELREAARRMFEHGYRATIWPMVLPQAMQVRTDPTDVERLIQDRYQRSGELARWSVQRTSMRVMAEKIAALVKDAEAKDDVSKKTETTNLQANFQTMQNTTEMLNMQQQEVAQQHAESLKDQGFSERLSNEINEGAADLLLKPGGL